MNPILQDKLNELESACDYECWYLVKQPTEFDCLCYLVSFLNDYKASSQSSKFQDYMSKRIHEFNSNNSNISISDNYRALRVAAFFGLITMTSSQYKDAVITDTFKEITVRCNGKYECMKLYTDIIRRQIEKMFISSEIDNEYKGIRKDFRLYPVMLLYKILLELGRSYGSYSISISEYKYFVATTKIFENFLDTLLLINLFRKDTNDVSKQFEDYSDKFDNRLILALKQLDTLDINDESICLKNDKIKEVAEKVFAFEENPTMFTTDDYLVFLGSTKSLFDLLSDSETGIEKESSLSSGIDTGSNILLYGVPGSGKSWTIEHEYCGKDSITERIVFHPDYTYSDFVGQILPAVAENGQVSYKFTPGPFTSILRDAYNNPSQNYILIIEEINRGNAPAIFGEVFQLLDRKVEIRENDDDGFPIGTSEYGIINEDIAEVMYGKDRKKDEVRIPSNLSIIGTMNTSDQNVFTLDTAFQRRWDMYLVENNFENVDPKLANAEILDTGVTWKNFCVEINKIIIGNSARMTSAEDKRLGAYFIHLCDLQFDSDMGDLKDYDELRKRENDESFSDDDKNKIANIRKAMRHNRKFPEKVIKYLWDDAFKFNREVIFDTSEYQSLEQVIHDFMYSEGSERFKALKDNVRDAFTGKSAE